MGIFNKDIIEKELDYRSNPEDNMRFQITRYFYMLYDKYYTQNKTVLKQFIIRKIELLFNTLMTSTIDWWKGPWKRPVDWVVHNISSGICIEWRYPGHRDWESLNLIF